MLHTNYVKKSYVMWQFVDSQMRWIQRRKRIRLASIRQQSAICTSESREEMHPSKNRDNYDLTLLFVLCIKGQAQHATNFVSLCHRC